MLVLPDRHYMTAERHLAFWRCFGTLKSDLKAETSLDGHPEILGLSNMKQGGKSALRSCLLSPASCTPRSFPMKWKRIRSIH
ncbi:MAG: hypothetical protein OXI74_18535 [Rhodospirillaceae bacterium]|nr:hypothetical protein [Rhodospirillaceae bacterium]